MRTIGVGAKKEDVEEDSKLKKLNKELTSKVKKLEAEKEALQKQIGESAK